MATVTVHEAKTNLSKLIARALAGEEVVIANRMTPQVKLVPVAGQPKIKRTPGALKGKISLDDGFWDPLPEEELKAWGF